MNVEIGTEALQFLFSEYLFQILGIVSLQCKLTFTFFLNLSIAILCNYFSKYYRFQNIPYSTGPRPACHA
jgi:hypothetical protein